jgi:hypothetical protein
MIGFQMEIFLLGFLNIFSALYVYCKNLNYKCIFLHVAAILANGQTSTAEMLQ